MINSQEKITLLTESLDNFMFNTDIYPNMVTSFSFSEQAGNTYISPKGLLLLCHTNDVKTSMIDAIESIMLSCDVSNNHNFAAYAHKILGTIFNPYELELLDIAYFGDFLLGDSTLALIKAWERIRRVRGGEDYKTDDIMDMLGDALFTNSWKLSASDPIHRIPIILEMAKRYLQRNDALNFKFITEYCNEHYEFIANDIELLYMSDD